MSPPPKSCALCQKPVPIQSECSGCHLVSYCSKEHQKQDWKQHKPSCKAYEVKLVAEQYGHYVVLATRNIKEGDVIVNEEPLLIGPSHIDANPPSCLGCFTLPKARCPFCDWPLCHVPTKEVPKRCPRLETHRPECEILCWIKASRIDSLEAILPIRWTLMQKGDREKWEILFKEFALPAVTLTDARQSRKGQIIYEQMITEPMKKKCPEVFKNYLPETYKKEVKLVFSMLDAYGLDLKLPATGSLVGVCAVTSKMEHSCLPNTRRRLALIQSSDTGKVRCSVIVRAARDIRKGELLTTTFTDNMMGTVARQRHLMENRKFVCKCARCSDPTELGTHLSTMKCTECEHGWVLPIDTKKIAESDWKCDKKCGKVYSAEDIEKTVNKLSFEMEASSISNNANDAKQVEKLLERLLQFLHPNHYLCLKLKIRLFKLYGSSAKEIGRLSDADLNRKEELCEEVYEVVKNPCLGWTNNHLDECLLHQVGVKEQQAKRKKESGVWNLKQLSKALDENDAIYNQIIDIRGALYDPLNPPAPARPPTR